MKNLKDLISESILNEAVNEKSVKLWIEFSEEKLPENNVIKEFNKNLLALFDDKQEWNSLQREGFLEDFLCNDAWDNWCEDFWADDEKAAKEAKDFWMENYKKYIKF